MVEQPSLSFFSFFSLSRRKKKGRKRTAYGRGSRAFIGTPSPHHITTPHHAHTQHCRRTEHRSLPLYKNTIIVMGSTGHRGRPNNGLEDTHWLCHRMSCGARHSQGDVLHIADVSRILDALQIFQGAVLCPARVRERGYLVDVLRHSFPFHGSCARDRLLKGLFCSNGSRFLDTHLPHVRPRLQALLG